jgi:hypothetical protein
LPAFLLVSDERRALLAADENTFFSQHARQPTTHRRHSDRQIERLEAELRHAEPTAIEPLGCKPVAADADRGNRADSGSADIWVIRAIRCQARMSVSAAGNFGGTVLRWFAGSIPTRRQDLTFERRIRWTCSDLA